MFRDLHFVNLVVVDLVLCSLDLLYCLCFCLPVLIFIFSVLATRLVEKSISNMNNLLSSATLSIQSISLCLWYREILGYSTEENFSVFFQQEYTDIKRLFNQNLSSLQFLTNVD